MSAFSDVFKFILVAPKGLSRNWDVSSSSRDVTLVADIIEAVSEDYRIHPDRIYATGISKGGGMSQRLACSLSDQIAAIGLIAVGNPWFLNSDVCEPARPVPFIQFNGTADLIIPYYGGTHPISGREMPPVADMFGAWLDLYGCSGQAKLAYCNGEVTCFVYEDCDDEATIKHCIVEGGGHNWPGAVDLYELDPEANWWAAPHTTTNIDASEAVWKFFAQHPKARPIKRKVVTSRRP
jgi:polyhydroxybutyrate depolymerase